MHSVGNIAKARSRLKFTSEFSLEQGLELTLEWYRGTELGSGNAEGGKKKARKSEV